MDFVGGHALEHGRALPVGARQTLEMIVEMRFDLALGLGDEAQAHAIAGETGSETDADAAQVPERVEQARAAAELFEPCVAPREMIALLGSRVRELRAHLRRARYERLSVVKPLRRELAGAVD